jgi:purine nucleosidase
MFTIRCSRWILLALGLLSAAFTLAAQARPTPIVLDTDIGTDIDDAFALALVLKSPELDLRAVTTVSGDTQARARLAAKMLWEAGRREVPVAAGTPGGKLDIAQTRWADGFNDAALVQENAVELMRKEIDRAPGEIVIVAIGPLTNVAALLEQHPGERRKIRRIALMGGSIRRGYSPGSGPTAEYNIAADAKASQVVFSAGIPILMAPLDVTAGLQLEAAQRQEVFKAARPLGKALRALYELWGQPTPTLHDPMAVSLLLQPQLCTVKPLAIEVTAQGMTVAGEGGRPNAEVAVKTNAARFLDFYVKRLTR